MSQLVLAFDVVNQRLVSFQGSSLSLDNFRQSVFDVTVYLVQPTANLIPGQASYTIFDATAYDGLRVGIWQNSTGTAGDAAGLLLALTDQTGWTYTTDISGNKCFTGQFNVNTDQVATWLGTAAYKPAFFAINLTLGTLLYTVFDQRSGSTNCTINAATDEFSGVPINVTGIVPLISLPCQWKNAATGHIFALTEVASSPPTLQFTCINP